MPDYITYYLIGDTGAGKSSLGNLIVEKSVFKASSSVDPVTTEARAEENTINGVVRCVIDTEGLNDGQQVSSIQIQNMAKTLRKHKKGVNAIVLILNGQYDRFSQGVKDIIKFAYNSFSTKDALKHIAIVFTRCFANQPNYPNREEKRNSYGLAVRRYLSQISGVPLDLVPIVPIFFVDSYDPNGSETKENMMQLNGWASSKEPLDTSKFVEAGYREDRFEEKRTRYSVGFETRGNIKYQKFEDQKRTKVVPNNGDPVRYTEWVKEKQYEEAIEKKETKRQTVDRGYIFSNDGMTRYKVTVDQIREDVIDLKTNKVSTGYWCDVKEHKNEDGRKHVEKENRRMIVKEKQIIKYWEDYYFLGFSHTMTKYKMIETIHYQTRDKITNFDGSTSYSGWLDWNVATHSWEGDERGKSSSYSYTRYENE